MTHEESLEQFAPYQPSLLLQEIGFDEPCFGVFHNENFLALYSHQFDYYYAVNAPLWQQAFDWFVKKHKLVFCYEPCLKKKLTYIFFIYVAVTREKVFVVESKYVANKEARLACLLKLIEIVKNKT